LFANTLKPYFASAQKFPIAHLTATSVIPPKLRDQISHPRRGGPD
jgi:hypothetical protein